MRSAASRAGTGIMWNTTEQQREPASPACLLPTPHVSDAELTQKLACLESRLDTRESAHRPACAGAPPRAGEIGRPSHHHAGVPYATIHGKTDAQSASSRGEKRVCLPGTAASTTASSRTTCSLAQTSSDRILRIGHLRDREYHKKARCIWSLIRERGLTAWRPSPRSVSLGLSGALPRIEDTTRATRRTFGRPPAVSAAIPTSTILA